MLRLPDRGFQSSGLHGQMQLHMVVLGGSWVVISRVPLKGSIGL